MITIGTGLKFRFSDVQVVWNGCLTTELIPNRTYEVVAVGGEECKLKYQTSLAECYCYADLIHLELLLNTKSLEVM